MKAIYTKAHMPIRHRPSYMKLLITGDEQPVPSSKVMIGVLSQLQQYKRRAVALYASTHVIANLKRRSKQCMDITCHRFPFVITIAAVHSICPHKS